MNEIEKLNETLASIATAFEEHKKTLTVRDIEIKSLGKARGETETKLAKLSNDFDALGDRKAHLEQAIKDITETKGRMEKLELSIKRGGGSSGNPELDALTVETKSAWDRYLRRADSKTLDALIERKSMSVSSDPDGGYTVTADMSGRVAKRIFEVSPMRLLANVQTISTDALEGLADIEELQAGWVAETTPRPETTTAKIGKWRVPTHEMYAKPLISQKLLEDSALDVEGYVSRKMGDRFARLEGQAFVLGTTPDRPRGFTTYANGTAWGQIQQIVSGAAATFTYDGIMNLIYSLKSFYLPNSKFAMNRLSMAEVRKIKDLQGRPLWNPGLEAGQPSTLSGYAIVEMPDMANPAAASLSIGFGDFNEGYQIVDRLGLAILRDPYSSKPFVEIYGRKRVGGDVVNFEAFKLMRTSV